MQSGAQSEHCTRRLWETMGDRGRIWENMGDYRGLRETMGDYGRPWENIGDYGRFWSWHEKSQVNLQGLWLPLCILLTNEII